MGGLEPQGPHGRRLRDILFSSLVMVNVNGPISIRPGGSNTGDENIKPWLLHDSRWQAG
jgi:hypothetical protein